MWFESKSVTRTEAGGGIVTYKTRLGGFALEIWPYTNTLTETSTFLFLFKRKRKRPLDELESLTYDWVETTSTDENGYETSSGHYVIGYRMKNDVERTLFSMRGQQESYDLVTLLKQDLGISIDRKKYL